MKPFYKSKTIWGLTLSGILPAVSTLMGIDVITGIDIVKNIHSGFNDHYNFIQWLEVSGQLIGYVLTIYGTIDKNRSPLKFK